METHKSTQRPARGPAPLHRGPGIASRFLPRLWAVVLTVAAEVGE